jgi:hypothetical protein
VIESTGLVRAIQIRLGRSLVDLLGTRVANFLNQCDDDLDIDLSQFMSRRGQRLTGLEEESKHIAGLLTTIERYCSDELLQELAPVPKGKAPDWRVIDKVVDYKAAPDRICVACFDNVVLYRGGAATSSTAPTFGVRFKCGHYCCEDCVPRWVETALKDRSLMPLKCGQCNDLVDTTCREFRDILERFSKMHDSDLSSEFEMAELVSQLRNPVFCPKRGCGAAFESPVFPEDRPRPSNWFVSQCETCNTPICLQCRVKFHRGYTCQEYQQIPAEDRNPEDLELYRLACTS